MEEFDIEALKLGDQDLSALVGKRPRRIPRHQPGEPFLKGPIPWDWLKRAGGLPGNKTLHIALMIWKEVGCNKRPHPTVRFCLSRAKQWGISPDTARRALRVMKEARLLEIEHSPGKCMLVTVLPVVSGPEDE